MHAHQWGSRGSLERRSTDGRGFVPHHGPHPGLRERGGARQPGRRQRFRQGRRRQCPGPRPAAPVHRPGGGAGRRLRPPAPRGLPHLHAPRPRPHAGQGRRPARHDVRAVRQGQRLQRRQGRLDAHRGLLGRHARRQRRGRGRPADRRRRGPCAEAAAAATRSPPASSATAPSTAARSWKSLNWARVYRLPVLFVCEDNRGAPPRPAGR